MSKRNEVLECVSAVKEANISLAIAVQTAWPKGSAVCVKVGRAKIDVQVIGHGNYLLRTGQLRGVNPKTQKPRWFHHSSIVERPQTTAAAISPDAEA